MSVVIPCYNAEKYISQAVDSALTQSYPVAEIIIVNDGSTDQSAAIIEYYARAHPERVQAISHPNQGTARTRDAGVYAAKGDYIVPLDGDDYLHPDAVATWLRKVQEQPQYSVIYGDYYRVDGESRIISEMRISELRDDPLEGDILSTMLRWSVVTATCLIRRDRLIEVGGYCVKDSIHAGSRHEDYFLYLRLLLAGYEFGYVPQPLFYYRDIPTSASKNIEKRNAGRVAALQSAYRTHPERMAEATDIGNRWRATELEHLWAEISQRDSQIHEYRRQLEEQADQLHERSQQLHAANLALAERDQQLHSANLMLAERDQQLHAAYTTLAERDQQLHSANMTTAERDQQLHTANTTTAERDRQLHEAYSTIAERDQQLHTAYAATAEREQQLARLKGQVQALQAELDALNATRAVRFMKSTWWPIMTRLRR